MNAATTFKLIGVNSDCDTCTHCGKTNLKRVVWLAPVVAGEQLAAEPVGVNCAALLLKRSAGRVQKDAEQADRDRDEAARRFVHEVGEVRSVRPVIVERVGQNGGSVTFVAMANGLLSAVERWADEKFGPAEYVCRFAR